MASMLKRHDRDLLKVLIGRKCGLTLLFKATRDGCDATTFHTLCDDKGPTITVLCNTENSVFGGYVSQSWDKSDDYKEDADAFLFRLKRNGELDPVKMRVHNSSYALYCESSYGPTFGEGHDLYTFSGAIENSGKHFALNGSVDIGDSYDPQGEDTNSVSNGHLNVKDIEVYQVQEGLNEVDDLRETPWRSDIDWNEKTLQKLKSEIQSYKPAENLNIPEVNILLLGQVAAGKSSLFNTINSVFRGEVSARARSGTAEHSLTTKISNERRTFLNSAHERCKGMGLFRRYRIKDVSSGSYLHIRLCDTRGLEPGEGLRSSDLGFLLDGHVPEHYQFNPSATISPTMFGFVKNPEDRDKIHAVALVIDASTFDVLPEAIITKIKDLQTVFNTRDLPQVIFLTKIDKVCQEVSENITCVFRSGAILDVLSDVADCFGLPRGHVFPVKNYESETEVNDNVSILVLKALKQLLNFTDEYLEDQFENCASVSNEAQK